jgi:hypothetical protein
MSLQKELKPNNKLLIIRLLKKAHIRKNTSEQGLTLGFALRKHQSMRWFIPSTGFANTAQITHFSGYAHQQVCIKLYTNTPAGWLLDARLALDFHGTAVWVPTNGTNCSIY